MIEASITRACLKPQDYFSVSPPTDSSDETVYQCDQLSDPDPQYHSVQLERGFPREDERWKWRRREYSTGRHQNDISQVFVRYSLFYIQWNFTIPSLSNIATSVN